MTDSRPFFQELSLQSSLTQLLQQEIEQQTLSHAYLFSGPAGSGKKSLALRFAFAILAQSDPNAALFFREGHHPDLLVLSRPEKKNVLTKAQITDELIPWLGYKPYQAQKKVAVLFDSHVLSPEGANALLKTLEEPPEYAVLILVSDKENLLETIRSRCRILRFHPIPEADMTAFLQKKGCPEEKAREIALISRGDISLALTFLETDLSVLREKAQKLLQNLQTGGRSAIFPLANALETDGKPLFNFIWILLRDQLLYAETGDPSLLLFPTASAAFSVSPAPRNEVLENWKVIQKLQSYYDSNLTSETISFLIASALYRCFSEQPQAEN